MISSTDLPQAPVFKPTYEEFKDFSKYLNSIEKEWKAYGICKIIPPEEWRKQIPFKLEEVDELEIPSPITQYVDGNKGVYQLMLVENKNMKVKDFREKAEKSKMPRSEKYKDEPEDIDRIFWKNVRFNPAIYGADMLGSLLPPNLDVWNMNNLDSILRFMGKKLPGVTVPYLYFGMWKAMFAWHVEDMNLFSINYIHHGAPKTWYAVPPEYGPKFERMCQTYFPENHRNCSEFLRHKNSLISPSLLLENSIPVTTMVHREGEIALTYAYSYHSGFNHGFNCAESVNFALESWIPYGLQARSCKCQSDAATINVEEFAKCYANYKDTGFFYDQSLPLWDPLSANLEITNITPITSSSSSSPTKKSSPKKHKESTSSSSTTSSKLASSSPELPPSKKHSPKRPKEEPLVLPPTTTTKKSPEKEKKKDLLIVEQQEEEDEEDEEEEQRGGSSSQRKKMKRITDEEISMLNQTLEQHSFAIPNLQMREELAAKLGWTAQGVYNWFRRRLMKLAGVNSLKKGLPHGRAKLVTLSDNPLQDEEIQVDGSSEDEGGMEIHSVSSLFSSSEPIHFPPEKKRKNNKKQGNSSRKKRKTKEKQNFSSSSPSSSPLSPSMVLIPDSLEESFPPKSLFSQDDSPTKQKKKSREPYLLRSTSVSNV